MRKQYSEPVSADAITEKAFSAFDALELNPELEEHRPYFRAKLAQVFEEANLPATLPHKLNFSGRIRNPLARAFREAAEDKKIDVTALKEIQNQICTEVNFLFFRDYIASTLSQKLIPYCQTHPAPKQWGLYSIFYWDAEWGRAFYSFWRNSIEKKVDKEFRKKILPFLSPAWRQSYQMKKEKEKCPYDWGHMTNGAIAKTLMHLKKRTNPSTKQWWIGSIAYWTDPETGNLWGKSFWAWWRKNVEQEGDERFTEQILPKFPKSWQKNFKPMTVCPLRWREMNDQFIATALSTLVSPHGFKKWGLGSLEKWYDPSTKKKYGLSFCGFWRSNNKTDAEKEFRERIVPFLPPHLRDSYRPVGYIIPFHKTTKKDHEQADALNDLDSLHREAHKGNRAAFEKLKNLINVDCPEAIKERMIHMHVPLFGTMERYASGCAKKFFKRFIPLLPDQTSRPRTKRKHGAPGREEDDMIDKIDAKRILEGMDPSAIDELLDI